MKKRTGAQSAMAELLSKSNETQIKDKRVQPAISRPTVPAKNPEAKKDNIAVTKARHQPSAVRPAPTNAPAAKPATIKAAAPATQHTSQMSAMPKPPAKNNVPEKAQPAIPVKRKSPKKKSKSSKKIPYIAPVVAGLAVAVIGVFIIFVVAISTASKAAVVPDAYIGNDLEVSEKAKVLNIAEEDAAKHDGRNYITISVFEGDEIVCSTGATTIGEVLESMSVAVEEDYVLRGNETDAITADSVISIDKVTYGTITEESSVPYETRYVDVQTIAKGKTKVVNAGKNGVSTATYNVTYVNGVESERVLVSQVVTTQPTTQVVNRGVGGTVTIGGKTYNYSYYIDCETTVYTGGGTTASGLPATEKVIAVDPRVIPLGTQVYIEDPSCYVGIRTAADTGGSIKGNIIDIYFNEDNPSLWGYGRRHARVYILE